MRIAISAKKCKKITKKFAKWKKICNFAQNFERINKNLK